MFAARFDPTKPLVRTEEKKVILDSVLPAKRTNEVLDSSPTDDEQDGASEKEENTGEETEGESSTNESGEIHLENMGEDDMSGDDDESDKHASVLNRFHNTLKMQDTQLNEDYDHEESDGEENSRHDSSHHLVPIPQPKKVRNLTLNSQEARTQEMAVAWHDFVKVVYDPSMVKAFKSYGHFLDSAILANLEAQLLQSTFPVQTAILDALLPSLFFQQANSKSCFPKKVGDVLVNASTGSGKTLAYCLPVVQSLFRRTVNRLRCLILVPTKILISQVYQTMIKLTRGTSLIVAMSKLENSLKEEHKKFESQEPDILIITPGRLVDHLELRSFNVKNLKFLVLDEADRLLNQSFQNWCSVLITHLKREKPNGAAKNVVKMVFSATLTSNTEKLHNLNLNKPRLFLMDTVKLYHLPRLLQEYNFSIPSAKNFAKPLYALRLIISMSKEPFRVLMFVRSNQASMRLAALFEIMMQTPLGSARKIKISSINSNNSKGHNRKLIQAFASANANESAQGAQVMICTDLMSRGVDISKVSHVVNYDLPISSQQYVHRCGRTARAHESGIAINLLVGKGERKFWEDQINVDLSRDVDGCQVRSTNERDNDNEILSLSKEDEQVYRNCLGSLKSVAFTSEHNSAKT
ncbi:LAMI_0A00892g1_1 [Lachancea mirantina]|uniref:ATP-dependent RNA helicase n=1 Tax=Lachancea mirantina TaxID=1230905 RepID=A0A1G4ILF2_9SACH|nr:LAMI_0A00892g1_1 [Lachancea mirantina]